MKIFLNLVLITALSVSNIKAINCDHDSNEDIKKH